MSFAPWITIPAEDVSVQLPLSMADNDIRVMFKTTEAIDKTIEQLENLKRLMTEMAAHSDALQGSRSS